ncbi:MAG: ParB/RepB/Spo0J family partition protein [Sulfuritalea sp.]|nr:ParB/RepB/Spo0J family partition protein [Sulfuritalea sp.]
MSLKELRKKSAAAMDQSATPPSTESDSAKGVDRAKRPATSPGATAMMQPTIDALNDRAKAAERKVSELEARIKDLHSTALPLESIGPNPWQPRRVFDPKEIESLGESIAAIGLIQPIVVRRSVRNSDTPSGTVGAEGGSVRNSDTEYEIVAGERRYRAHKLIGHPEIKAVVVDVSDDEMAIMALAENIDRKDLFDYEIAVAIRNAQDSFPSKKEMARSLGKQRTELYSYLAFFKLPDFVIRDLELNPSYLGRAAAEDLAAVIAKHGKSALDALSGQWPRIKSRDIDQGKIAAMIEAFVLRGPTVRTDRDIKKLFIGKEQAGSITRDASALTVKIRTAAMSPRKESKLREFVQQLLIDPD